ncbi:MAG: polymer-forming cytoskeletal protein [Polyangiaceae bacterium]
MAAASSIIAEGTVIRGNVRGRGSIEIRGHVEGDVEVDGDVALSEGAGVEGNVSGAQLVIAGQVSGDLRGTDAVLLERGARVVGDLVAPRIGIADGALIRGHVRTEGEPSAPRKAQVAVARRPLMERPAAPVAVEANHADNAPKEPAAKPATAPRRGDGPPAPVVPALAKGVRGKKKRAKRT